MKYTLPQIQGIHQRWLQSGLSRKSFCDQESISYQTFNYWYKRLTADVKSTSGFVAVNLPEMAGVSFEVSFPSGTRIMFHQEPTVNWLRELVG